MKNQETDSKAMQTSRYQQALLPSYCGPKSTECSYKCSNKWWM